jgi:DNA-binding transcriptional LysR family regulator
VAVTRRLELSMRRDLGAAVDALRRHELDLAFGDVGGLGQPLPDGLQAELVATDTLALLVNADSRFAGRDHVSPEELDRIWLPGAGSSRELLTFAARFAQAAEIELDTDGVNLGLAAVVARVAAEPELVCAIVADWPVSDAAGVCVVAVRPAPEFPWYAVWRTESPHPSLPRVLGALRERQ